MPRETEPVEKTAGSFPKRAKRPDVFNAELLMQRRLKFWLRIVESTKLRCVPSQSETGKQFVMRPCFSLPFRAEERWTAQTKKKKRIEAELSLLPKTSITPAFNAVNRKSRQRACVGACCKIQACLGFATAVRTCFSWAPSWRQAAYEITMSRAIFILRSFNFEAKVCKNPPGDALR